jgi:methylenetetrahydrofolate reductase (NADPH)
MRRALAQKPPPPAGTDRPGVAALLGCCSIELAPQDELAGKGLRDFLAPGREVFVNHAASASHHAIVAACARLRQAGFAAVPHVAARRLLSFTQARDFLERAAESGVDTVLLVGGDMERPAGPFDGSLALLQSGLVERSGIRHVAFAGYPQGHPRLAAARLEAALADKLRAARERGLAASIVTQFGFAGRPIRRYVAALRARGVDCPVRVGLAGPADIATLARFAVRCGVAASLSALARGHAAFARILVEAGPEPILEALLREDETGAAIDAIHLYTFGGARRTAEWLRELTNH